MQARNKAILPLILSLPILLSAAAPQRFELTVPYIMRGGALVGYAPRELRWSGDGQRIYFAWKQPGDPVLAEFDTYVIDRDGTGLRKLSDEEARMSPPVTGDLSPDKSKSVFVRDRDLFVYDLTADKARRLTRTGDVEGRPHFLRDSRRVSFIRSNNLYVVSLDDGMVDKMTNVRSAAVSGGGQRTDTGGVDREDKKGTESQEFLKREEKELLDVIRQRTERREEEEARRMRDNWRKPHSLAPRQSMTAMELTPDGKYIVASISERNDQALRTNVPNYVTETAYPEIIAGRTKAGDLQDKIRLAVISVETGEMRMVDHGLTESALENSAREDVDSKAESSDRESQTKASGKPRGRDVALSMPIWSEDGTKAVILARASDNKDAWIMALDVARARARPITSVHDDAWIGGPGAFNLGRGPGGSPVVGWMKDDRSLYFQSEKTGYSHLYTVPYEGGEPRQLTSGKWEVLRLWQSLDKSQFYLETSEADPGERHLYRMSAEGGERTRLTTATGQHEGVALSRDEKYFVEIFSIVTRPPELYLQENRPEGQRRKFTSSPSPDFWSYQWREPELVYIPARDGARVPAHLFRPAKPRQNGPAVIFVHGAGYYQNVHRGWSGAYYHEYLFHNLLADKGYTVLQLDYRGSAGYGRDWRTAIYRHMGGKDLDDHVDAAHWLVKELGVNPKKIGIYGGSYGGFITLMAMFTQPDVFAAGAALRPVTDWAHYNHPYTSNILELPQRDAEAYRVSSPIYHAAGLKGALLICHGIADTNVHFQDTVRLVQRLIELQKTNWELAVFPAEDHSFVQSTSWTDEYRRILDLFEENLAR